MGQNENRYYTTQTQEHYITVFPRKKGCRRLLCSLHCCWNPRTLLRSIKTDFEWSSLAHHCRKLKTHFGQHNQLVSSLTITLIFYWQQWIFCKSYYVVVLIIKRYMCLFRCGRSNFLYVSIIHQYWVPRKTVFFPRNSTNVPIFTVAPNSMYSFCLFAFDFTCCSCSEIVNKYSINIFFKMGGRKNSPIVIA